MKTLLNISLMTLFLFSSPLLKGGEVTGAGMVKNILERQNISLDKLLNEGNELLLGEVTGAGRRVKLERIRFVLTESEAFDLKKLKRIEFKKAAGMTLENVSYFEVENKVVELNEIQAMIVKK